MAGLSNPGLELVVAETEVFSGTSPNAWTDLDLSAVIGAQATLVILKIYCPAVVNVCVRRNGDTDDSYEGASNPAGISNTKGVAGVHQFLATVTDIGGKIEWKTGIATASSTIDVVSYLK